MQNLYKAQCIRVADIDNDGKKEYLISAPTPSMFMILKKYFPWEDQPLFGILSRN